MTVKQEELGEDSGKDDVRDGYVPSQRRLDRERHKRARARRATAIAALSTLVTAVVR